MNIKKLKNHPLSVKLLVLLIKAYCFVIFHTCKFTIKIDQKSRKIIESQQCILALWHSRILLFPKLMQKYGVFTVVASSHADGEFITSVIRSYQHRAIRGSSRRNALSAMRAVLKAIEANQSIVITPDGPKGPRYKINGNITNIASRASVPIILLSYSAKNAVVLNTWDRFLIPLPFCEIAIEVGPTIYLERDVESNDTKVAAMMFEQMLRLDTLMGLKIDY